MKKGCLTCYYRSCDACDFPCDHCKFGNGNDDMWKPAFELDNKEEKTETVFHPSHYNRGKIETIDYLKETLSPEAYEGFLAGNILKYLSRYPLKGGVEDLQKARFYLDKLIEKLTKPDGV